MFIALSYGSKPFVNPDLAGTRVIESYNYPQKLDQVLSDINAGK